MFQLQWNDENTENYEELYRTFVRIPVVWNETTEEVDKEAVYDDPRQVFPNSYVEYIETLYGKEDDVNKSMISLISKSNLFH